MGETGGGQMKSKDVTPIYLKAMEYIESEREFASCPAISPYYENKKHPDSEPAQLYASIFSPDGLCGGARSPFHQAVESGPDPKGHRLMMLAMAAACWRDFL